MDFLLQLTLVLAILAAIIVGLLKITSGSETTSLSTLVGKGLLILAGILGAGTSLFALATAAWGMDVRLPWGLGVYVYLLPALMLPSFLLLLWIRTQRFANILWFLTLAEPFAFYFGDRADRVSKSLPQITNPREILGMLFNAFSLLMIGIAFLVQLAALCQQRPEQKNSHVTS